MPPINQGMFILIERQLFKYTYLIQFLIKCQYDCTSSPFEINGIVYQGVLFAQAAAAAAAATAAAALTPARGRLA